MSHKLVSKRHNTYYSHWFSFTASKKDLPGWRIGLNWLCGVEMDDGDGVAVEIPQVKPFWRLLRPTFNWLSSDIQLTFVWLFTDFWLTFDWLATDFQLTFDWPFTDFQLTFLLNFNLWLPRWPSWVHQRRRRWPQTSYLRRPGRGGWSTSMLFSSWRLPCSSGVSMPRRGDKYHVLSETNNKLKHKQKETFTLLKRRQIKCIVVYHQTKLITQTHEKRLTEKCDL